MEKYETTNTTNFTLNSGQISTNFIRSQFDYGTRQRRAVNDYDTFAVRIVMDSLADLQNFESFWGLINDGTDKFLTDQVINGDLTTDKIVRFTSGYSLAQLSTDLFEVSVPLELIQTGV